MAVGYFEQPLSVNLLEDASPRREMGARAAIALFIRRAALDVGATPGDHRSAAR
jgi:hypothetical protein